MYARVLQGGLALNETDSAPWTHAAQPPPPQPACPRKQLYPSLQNKCSSSVGPTLIVSNSGVRPDEQKRA